MEFNWPTFFLEIVNFLVLVWILKRFLYQPVLAAIGQRKAAIDKTLSDATARQADAQALERQYQNRLADWESEKEKLRAEVAEEISAQRAQMMAQLENALKQEREKARVVEERRQNELRNRAEEAGIAKGVQFTGRLLARAASRELESKLVSLALEDLDLLPADQLQGLRSVSQQAGLQVKVTSAFPLVPAQRSAIVQKLKEMTQDRIAIEFNEDNRLLAGLRVAIGPWVLRANLQDELEFFAGAVLHGSREH